MSRRPDPGALARGLGPHRWLAVIAVVALAARLTALDRRAIHFDEARVGVEILGYLATGEYLYYPALHGPFLFHVDRALFAVIGTGDAVLRLPVAVVGGLLPLAAWLFRDHLDDDEVVALGLVLAANPLLLYYARFARSDLLLAASMLVALGYGLRLLATGRARYGYAGTAALALGLATKENAVLYLLSWAGATLVVGLAWRSADPDAMRRLRERLRVTWGRLGHAGLATVELLVLVGFLYVPRGGDRPGLADLLAGRHALAVVEAATLGPARRALAIWLYGGGHPPAVYVAFLGRLVALLVVTSLPLVAFAAVGVVAEWRRASGPDVAPAGQTAWVRSLVTGPRPLVAFAVLWAGAGIVGYPLASDIVAAWTVVHVVVPLAFPAAVGLAAVWSLARSPDGDRYRRVALAGLVLAATVVGGVAGWSSYAAPGVPYNPFGQPGQARGDLRATMDTVESVGAGHAGPDVAYVGDFYRTRLWRLPYEWYLAPTGVTATTRTLPLADPPPVVIALDVDADRLGPALEGYVCVEHDPYPWGPHKPGGRATETVVYVDRAALPDPPSRWRPASDCGPALARDRPLHSLLERAS